MRFVHIGDLHLGKVIYQFSLLNIQRELLFELLEYMNQEDIRTLVIAGDVYDRSIPSQEAVNLLDEFLSQALLDYHIEVFMISGNHDSSDRMHFASSILSSKGLHIETYLKESMTYVQKDDIRFYLLPFFKPSQVKDLFQDYDINTYQDAMNEYLKHQHFDKKFKNILITHQFVGSSSLTCESEVPLSVGGSEIIDASLFDDFDYVALGHLHSPQKVSRETIRYSGSIMPYSFDEVKQDKSIVIIDTDNMSVHFHRLHPSLTLQKYKGTFEQFMDPYYIEKKDDFLSLELENKTLIPHAIDQLRILYPHILQITYAHLSYQNDRQFVQPMESLKEMNMTELFCTFYKDVKNIELTSQQKRIVHKLLEKVGDSYENY